MRPDQIRAAERRQQQEAQARQAQAAVNKQQTDQIIGQAFERKQLLEALVVEIDAVTEVHLGAPRLLGRFRRAPDNPAALAQFADLREKTEAALVAQRAFIVELLGQVTGVIKQPVIDEPTPEAVAQVEASKGEIEVVSS